MFICVVNKYCRSVRLKWRRNYFLRFSKQIYRTQVGLRIARLPKFEPDKLFALQPYSSFSILKKAHTYPHEQSFLDVLRIHVRIYVWTMSLFVVIKHSVQAAVSINADARTTIRTKIPACERSQHAVRACVCAREYSCPLATAAWIVGLCVSACWSLRAICRACISVAADTQHVWTAWLIHWKSVWFDLRRHNFIEKSHSIGVSIWKWMME